MKELLSFVWVCDRKFWGDRCVCNPYFGTISVLLAALAGALQGGSSILHEWFEWDELSLEQSILFLVVLYGLNLYESIVSSLDVKTAVLRSLTMLLWLVVPAALGYVLAVVVLLIVAVIVIGFVFVMAVSIALGGGGGSSRSSRSVSSSTDEYAYDENGSAVKITRESGGYGFDEYGRRWKNTGSGGADKWESDE